MGADTERLAAYISCVMALAILAKFCPWKCMSARRAIKESNRAGDGRGSIQRSFLSTNAARRVGVSGLAFLCKLIDRREFSAVLQNYSGTIGEIETDTKIYMKRCDAATIAKEPK